MQRKRVITCKKNSDQKDDQTPLEIFSIRLTNVSDIILLSKHLCVIIFIH